MRQSIHSIFLPRPDVFGFFTPRIVSHPICTSPSDAYSPETTAFVGLLEPPVCVCIFMWTLLLIICVTGPLLLPLSLQFGVLVLGYARHIWMWVLQRGKWRLVHTHPNSEETSENPERLNWSIFSCVEASVLLQVDDIYLSICGMGPCVWFVQTHR